jgi:hypothetical protein
MAAFTHAGQHRLHATQSAEEVRFSANNSSTLHLANKCKTLLKRRCPSALSLPVAETVSWSKSEQARRDHGFRKLLLHCDATRR